MLSNRQVNAKTGQMLVAGGDHPNDSKCYQRSPKNINGPATVHTRSRGYSGNHRVVLPRIPVDFSDIRIEKQICLEENDVAETLKIVIFRVLQEALNNVAKHSKADFVRICLEKEWKNRIEFADNGVGFNRDDVFAAETEQRGFGLASMNGRNRLVELSTSRRGGGSTVIQGSWPNDK